MVDTGITVVLAVLAGLGVFGLLATRTQRDAVAVLSVYLLALFGLNARWVVPGGGAFATPAAIVAIGAAWLWWMARPAPALGLDRRPNPVRVVLLAYLWFTALSWAIGRLRRLSELEVNGSNRAVLTAVALTGIALLCVDGIADMDRFQALIRRVVHAGVVLSIVGLLQFFTPIDLVDLTRVPGLVLNSDSLDLASRSSFARAEGTALHSIEFSVVLAVILPLAIALAMSSEAGRKRYFTFATALIAAGIPLSISRSGVFGLILGLLVASAAWTWRERLNAVLFSITGVVVTYLAVPGLVGTLRSLFTNLGNDPSVTARLDRVPRALDVAASRRWLGAGVGTFSPDEDFLLDNQALETLIETGVVGLVVILLVFLVPAAISYLVGKTTDDRTVKLVAQALTAGLLVVVATMFTFDAFFYQILMGTAFVLIGCVGALWRLTRIRPTAWFPTVVNGRRPEAASTPGKPAV